MPNCLKCGAELAVNEEGIAPVLCDRCAGKATSRARQTLSTGTMRDYPATTALIAINLAAFVGMAVTGVNIFNPSGMDLIRWGANFGPLTLSGEYWRLVTAGFLHSGILHILFNMWCLWSLGQLAEKLFGKWQTFVIYLLTGIGGALLSIAYNHDRLEVGASGAIFGISGALLAGLKFGNFSVSSGERRSILSSMAFFVIINFTLGMRPNVDNMCHLGGFITGLLLGLPLGAFARHHKIYQLATILVTAGVLFAAGRELVQTSDDSLGTQVGFALAQKNYAKAIRLLEPYVASNPSDDVAFTALGEAYDGNQERDKAIAAYRQALKINPNSETAKAALEKLGGGDSPKSDR
jgi:rhomboid protease GluP